MEINFDEKRLLSQRVEENSEQDIDSQILRIAVYNKFKVYETYLKMIERFGFLHPFVNIKKTEEQSYGELIGLLEKHEIEIPLNDWEEKIEVPNSFIECCEVAVALEISNIAMYDNLVQYSNKADVKDFLFRLQANSYNSHLPMLRSCVGNFYASNQVENNLMDGDIMEKLGEYQKLVEDLMSGDVDQGKITKLLSKLNVSMISGAAFGSASVAFLNSYLQNKEEKE